MTETKPQTVQTYLKEHAEADPKTVLDIALAETERVQAVAEKAQQDYRIDSEVHLGPDGFQTTSLAQLYRLAHLYARTQMVPDEYRGRPDDCAVVLHLAKRWGLDPFLVFQQVYFVHGKPGLQGQLVIALLNTSRKLKGPLQYEFTGEADNYGCVAVGTDATTNEMVGGPKITRRMVTAEGWDKPKKNTISKWVTMPDIMFRYRAAALFGRMLYPEVLMGLQTTEELEDVGSGGLKSGDTVDPSDLDAVAKSLDAEDAPEAPTPTDGKLLGMGD